MEKYALLRDRVEQAGLEGNGGLAAPPPATDTELRRVHEPAYVRRATAGADPFEDDLLGRLGVSLDGLRRRDRIVFRAYESRGVPVVVTMAGGYARSVADTVAIHFNTVSEAALRGRSLPARTRR